MSFYSMEADLQEVRGEDARSVPSTFFPRCVQRSGIGQASLSGKEREIYLSVG